MRKAALLLFAVCLLVPTAAQGTWVTVDLNGGAQYTTITEALANAPDGAYVVVYPGTYSASTGETMPLQMRAGLTLQPFHGVMGSVIIDGEGLTRCIEVINPNSTTKVEKMVFQNGLAVTGDGNGGGMWIGGFETPVTARVLDCIFRDCAAANFGGGLYADQSARPALISGCRFSNNVADRGGGVYAIGNGPIQMGRCVFDGNTAAHYGGGLFVEFPDIARTTPRLYSMQRLTFAGNHAGFNGSAIYTDPTLYLSNSIIALGTSTNHPVMCSEYAEVHLSCVDVFGNTGGDYVGCLAGQLGIDGNIWNDPEFCGVGFEPDDPYSIGVNSPCADDNNGDCDRMGARPPKCGIPYLHFNWEWLEYYIPFGEEYCQNLVFENAGDLMLDWQLYAYEGVLGRGSGGPDAFGYRWGDSDKPDGPDFEWNDISGYGTPVMLGDDEATLIALPFLFPFYDTDWFEFALSSNGYLTFGYDWTASVNACIPSTIQPNEFIAPFWEDLDPSQGGTIHYYYSPDAGTFTVQFTEVPNASAVVGGEYTFQVVLYQDGTIRFYYLSMVGYVEGATIGIENPDGTIGLQVACNEPYMHDDLAVIVDLGPPPPAWFWMSLTEGTLSPGEEATVECCVEASDLEAGIYEATLVMVSNDFNDPIRYIPMTVEVHPTGVDDEVSTRLTLRGNYPNPFNPQTSIAFDLPEPARVGLRVFNAAGRQVRSLLEGVQMEAGPHVQPWDGKDDHGAALASGVYFCMLEVDGESLAGKMVLLK